LNLFICLFHSTFWLVSPTTDQEILNICWSCHYIDSKRNRYGREFFFYSHKTLTLNFLDFHYFSLNLIYFICMKNNKIRIFSSLSHKWFFKKYLTNFHINIFRSLPLILHHFPFFTFSLILLIHSLRYIILYERNNIK
jgi:hypothetical protein